MSNILRVRATEHPVAIELSRPHRIDGRDVNSIHSDEVREVPATAYYLRAIDTGSLELVEENE